MSETEYLQKKSRHLRKLAFKRKHKWNDDNFIISFQQHRV